MLFAIHCLDKDGVLDKRMAVMQAHRDYLETAGNGRHVGPVDER
jgi:uncharacterized protein YciI